MPFAARQGFFFQSAVEAGVVAHSITALGNANTATAQKKFGPTSAEFDGSGDGLKVIPNSETDFVFDGDITVEFWFRAQADTGDASASLVSAKQTGASSNTYQWFILWRNFDKKLQVALPGSVNMPLQSTALNTAQWYHVALVRNGTGSNNCTLYIDGTSVSTATATTAFGDTGNGDNNIGIGSFQDGSLSFNQTGTGYIDEVRISRTARYTSSFTPSSYPFVYDSDTELLVHCDGIGDNYTNFYDDIGTGIGRYSHDYTFVDNAKIDNGQAKFGSTSLYVDGANDYLQGMDFDSRLGFIDTDFTIEVWAYLVNNGGAYRSIMTNAWGSAGGLSGWYMATNAYNGTQKLGFSWIDTSGTKHERNAGTTLPLNQWIHLVVENYDGKLWLYVDGDEKTGGTISMAQGIRLNEGNTPFRIGSIANDGETYGWIDELRISNTARYQGTDFTPPTSAFTNDENTLMLLHFEGADESTEVYDQNG